MTDDISHHFLHSSAGSLTPPFGRMNNRQDDVELDDFGKRVSVVKP